MDAATITIGVGLAVFLALLGIGAGLAMASVDVPGFLIARLCFWTCAIDVLGFTVYLTSRDLSVSLGRIAIGALIAFVAVGGLIFSLQWINYREAMTSTTLYPANDPTPPPPVGPPLPETAFKAFLGTSVGVSTTMPHTVILMRNEPMLTVDRVGNDIRVTTLRIFDQRGEIIARIDDDGFWTAEGCRRKRPDPSTLIVFDRGDQQVLNMRVLNRNTLWLTGIFRHPALGVALRINDQALHIGGSTMSGMRLEGVGGADYAVN